MVGAAAAPTVSVLTTAYNVAAYVSEAIASVRAQTIDDWEMVLVDDGSTDDTVGIVRRHAQADPRVRLLEPGRLGRVGALNVGLAEARGRYVAVLDADDVCSPDRLALQIREFGRARGVTLVGSGCVEMDREGRDIGRYTYPRAHRLLMRRLELIGAFFPHSSALFPTALARDLGGYRANFARSMDIDLMLRLAEAGRMTCVPEAAVRLRRHSDSLSNTQGGRLQLTLGAAATVCHFLRKAGAADPGSLPSADWDQFIQWTERRLLDLFYYETMTFRSRLKSSLSVDGSLIRRGAELARVLSTPAGQRFLRRYVRGGTSHARQLAREYAKSRFAQPRGGPSPRLG
jgi:glycosyltransferase involved in cell wall biosynthesis